MKDNPLVDKSRAFALKTMSVCKEIKHPLINQLLRSATSIGANIHEANYAHSRADFVAKMQIALKECYETEYWLILFRDSKIIEDIQLLDNCLELKRMLIASCRTAKS